MAQLKDSLVTGDLRVTGKIYGTTTNSDKVNNLTVLTAVPANAKFTDTTYSSKTAASGGTEVSLVTTGEKYTWNAKTSNTGTVTSVATGVGLTGGTITGSGTVKAKLKSETASTLDSAAMGSTSGRQYAVGVDKSGYLSVNVPWTDTTYSSGTGISVSGTTINHSNSVTAGTAGTSSATSGNSLAVPYVTYDAQGHITASGTHTHTITNNITGSGTSGYIAKFNGANTITNGPAFGSSTSTFLRNDGSWATPTAAQTYTTCNLPKFTAAGSQAVTVSGITASSNPILDIYIDTAAHAVAFNEI